MTAYAEDLPSIGPFGRIVVATVLAVALVGATLFAISGVWPPLYAVETGSMSPNVEPGDMVFVTDEERYPGPNAVAETGVVTAESGEAAGYTRFGSHGDVIVFQPRGQAAATPVVHRAMFYVEAGEDWTNRASPSALDGRSSCEVIAHCPAPRSGFVTKGDANPAYDQIGGAGAPTGVVSPDWIVGTAAVRVPGLGWVRLGF